MELDQARSTLLVQKKSTDVIRDRFRRRERVKHRLRANAKVFTRAWITRRTRRNQAQQWFRHHQRFRLECFEHGRKRASLLFGRNNLRIAIPFCFQAERVVLAADEFRSSLDLITVIHVDRHEHVFDRGHRCAFTNVVLTETSQRSSAHLHHVRQLVDRVRAVVPEMGHRARAARRSCVLIGQIHQPACERIA